MVWKIRDLKTPRGEKVIESYLEKQEKKSRTRVIRTILMLGRYGPSLGMPYAKKIDRDLWELRISGKEAFRVFYTAREEEIILLHIFKKKTQKTPRQEIRIARKRLKEI